MNWYKVFWWISTADGIRGFFDAMSNIFTTLWVIVFIIFIIVIIAYGAAGSKSEDEDKEWKYWLTSIRKSFIWLSIFMLVTWTLYVITPTRKDAIFIVAGGAVGNFIASDSSAKAIPYELTLLVRDKIKAEIEDIKNPTKVVTDTLMSKSKDELIKLLKEKQ